MRILCAAFAAALLLAAEPVEVKSPDGSVVVRIDAGDRNLTWAIEYKGAPALLPSRLGLSLYSGAWELTGVEGRARASEWRPVYGERSVIPDRYNELVVRLRDRAAPFRPLELIVRAYDEGVAVRYRIGGEGAFVFPVDGTEFQFPNGSFAWEEHGTEGPYSRVPVADVKTGCQRPLTVELPSGSMAAVLGADIARYPTVLLSPVRGRAGVLAADLGGPVRGTAPYETPWHVVMLAPDAGRLIERNYLVSNLNPPSTLRDTSWIQPGKAIREVTLSTAGGRAAVDFAAKHGLQYVEYDAGWYGHEYDDISDATKVAPDPDRIKNIPNHGGLDLAEVIRYARERKIGVLLYVNRRALERQLDQILLLYAKWGVSGLKFGFVNVGSQDWSEWLHDAIRKAAEHRMLVDVHDSYRPGGYNRTYPNLLTQEGVRGNEHMPDAAHNATLPFTRALSGPMDYTICWTTPRLKTTKAHQLAMSVIVYSPLQFLYWYDRPSDIREEPALEFFRNVPTVWDETRVLEARIGEYVTMARRSGEAWFVGGITSKARMARMDLSFLEPASQYVATIHSKEPAVERRTVRHGDSIEVALTDAGGFAIEIRPK